jgi:NAD(P)H-dependent flavin oxidoreductase YrpB (nitropropane dioxygenase family)
VEEHGTLEPPPGMRPREGEVHARSPQGDVVAYQSDTPGRDYVGDIDALSLWSGQGVGLVRRMQPAADIVREIDSQAREVLAHLGRDYG